ncbi:MAG: type VI secretion system contractile sheath small subunit, partial [Verrucomicrobiota bacterium]
QIEYDVEVGGAIRKSELPWVTGVMADLSGDNAGMLKELKDRSFADVDAENFNAYLKSQAPRVNFAVDNLISGEGRMGVDVSFERLEDFTPDQFARKVGAEIEEIKLTKVKEGKNEFYQIKQDGPMSLQLGETCDLIDKLASEEYIGMKLGEKASDLEVMLIPDARDPNKSVLRITKKGHLAKLLDARNQLKELLIKVDGKSSVQKVLDEMLADPSLMRQIVDNNEA